jgi:hypothetical protein
MPRFELGNLVATPDALRALRDSGHAAAEFLRRHAGGDWGDLDGHDTKQNAIALREGGRLVSSYQTRKGETVWVITEADRSATTILLPSDY